MQSIALPDRFLIAIHAEPALRELDFYSLLFIPITVVNGSALAIDSELPCPVHVAHYWETSDGSRIDGARTALPQPVPPGSSDSQLLYIDAPPEPGTFTLRITLVQENVCWFSEPPLRQVASFDVSVIKRRWWEPATQSVRGTEREFPALMRRRQIACPEDLGSTPPWMSANVWSAVQDHYSRIPEPRIFEFGLGASTCHHIRSLYAAGGGTYVGVDHDPPWFATVCSGLKHLSATFPGGELRLCRGGSELSGNIGPVNVRLFLVPASRPSTGDGGPEEFADYLDSLAGEFDVIIVDGRARNAAITKALDGGHVRNGGMLLLHDAGRGRPGYLRLPPYAGTLDYRPSVDRMLAEGGAMLDGCNGHQLEACRVIVQRGRPRSDSGAPRT